jgi:small subunit ribosomal protein S6
LAEVYSVKREYETIYVLRPDVGREVTEAVANRVIEAVKTAGAVTQIENWGRRKLAFPVQKHKRGVYVYFKYAGLGDLVSEVERALRLQESVMKFQTVKLGELKGELEATDVKFEHIEQDGDDHDESLAQTLGLEGRLGRSHDDDDMSYGMGGDLDDDDMHDGDQEDD